MKTRIGVLAVTVALLAAAGRVVLLVHGGQLDRRMYRPPRRASGSTRT